MRVLAWLMALASWQSPTGVDPHSAVRPPPPSAVGHPQSEVFTPAPGQIVRIDVIPIDARGRILDALQPTDFDVRDDGVAQPIEAARLMRAGDQEARFIAIFLDEYHVSRGETDHVRDALTRFVDALGPRDMLAVMKPLDSLFTIQLTAERAAARAAIQQFEGRRGEYEARNAYERNFMAGTPARIEAARTQVALSAINALAVQLGTVDDRRKALIVLGEGMNRADRHRGLEYLPTIDTIVRSADRGNVAIYPLDPAGERSDDAGADTIRGLAGKTAGQAFASDIDAGLRRALDDSSAYYLLTYRAVRPDDGKFHAVQVDVKRPGAQVRSRDGYYAPSPDDALRAELLARIDHPKPPAPLEPATHVSTLIRPWFGMARGPDGRTRVTFVWEPAVHVPGERVRRVPSRLMLTALAPDNSVLFNGLVRPTGPGTLDGGTPSARAVFDMAPGRLRLRMAIQDAASQTLDSDVRSLSIRDMGTGVSIGTPEVMRARNAREFRALTETAVPVVSREFSRTERLLIRFHAYGPGDVRPQVSARLLSRGGSAMRELPIAALSSGTAEHEVDVPLAGLAAGDYVIELVATSEGGNAKDVIDFRVTN